MRNGVGHLRHRCGLCFKPWFSYDGAADCCTSHAEGADAATIALIRGRRRQVIATAAASGSPPWFVVSIATAQAEDTARAARLLS